MTDAEKMAERLEAGAFDFNADGPCWPGDDMAEAAALIRRLQAKNEDFLEQIAVQTESVLFKELQEIMKTNNALRAENAKLELDKTALECLHVSAYRAGLGEGWNYRDANDEHGFAKARSQNDHIAELRRIAVARAALSRENE